MDKLRRKEIVRKYYLKHKEQIKDYYENHKKHILSNRKLYYELNKEFINQKSKDYVFNHKDKTFKYQKEYRLNNKQQMIIYKKQWRKDNLDKLKEQNRLYRLNNPLKAKQWSKKCYDLHIDKRRLKSKERWYNNKDSERERQIRWRKNNPEKAKLLSWRRLSRIRNIIHKFNSYELRDKYIKSKGICLMCNKQVGINNLEIDHIIPISKVNEGFVYTINDMQLLCRRCNSIKGDNYAGEIPLIVCNGQMKQKKLEDYENE